MDAAAAYLEEKGIYGLVEYLLADLMLKQPAQPLEWLANRLLQLQKENTDATTVSPQPASLDPACVCGWLRDGLLTAVVCCLRDF